MAANQLQARIGENKMKQEYIELGIAIREARIKKGISLRTCAKNVGLSPTSLSMIEYGKFKPCEEIAFKISREIDLPFFDICYYTETLPKAMQAVIFKDRKTLTRFWDLSDKVLCEMIHG